MYNRDKSGCAIVLLYIVILFSVLLVILLCQALTSFNDHTYSVTVSDKERIVQGNTSYYLIFCKDDEGNYYEFKNEDNYVRLKFNSSTFYNKIEVGEKYEFTVVGYRVEMFSWYENIIGFEKIE